MIKISLIILISVLSTFNLYSKKNYPEYGEFIEATECYFGGFRPAMIDIDKLKVKESIDTNSSYQKSEEYPEPDEFVACEKTPNIDIKKLQSLVEFPKKYGSICIDGRVIVKILVAKNGDIVKKIIEKTDSELLNEAAFDALDKYGKVEPAIQKGESIHCWISVPITFRLR